MSPPGAARFPKENDGLDKVEKGDTAAQRVGVRLAGVEAHNGGVSSRGGGGSCHTAAGKFDEERSRRRAEHYLRVVSAEVRARTAKTAEETAARRQSEIKKGRTVSYTKNSQGYKFLSREQKKLAYRT